AYVRFEGHPLGLTLEIEMNSTHETEVPGLLDRIDVTIAERFAPEVKQEKIRTRKRKVAGLDGEEAILRSSYRYGSKTRKTLDFAWLFIGKKDSGEYPEVIIDMESEEGQLEAKTLLWDRMLDSMKPMYQP
ncbi:MAG: T6SS immunity protein Tli4 family protein, partial [Candidatus Manganitrophaceae bacterium]